MISYMISSLTTPQRQETDGRRLARPQLSEVSTFKAFLPALWGIWQAVSDPAINRKASLKIRKEAGKIIYVK